LRDAGTRVDKLAVIGGGARSAYWGRIISAAVETPLVYLRGGEVGPALGAARLAQVAVDQADPTVICAPPPVERVVEPLAADIDLLAPKKAAFREAYPHISPKMKGQ
jgi:xylulokinase